MADSAPISAVVADVLVTTSYMGLRGSRVPVITAEGPVYRSFSSPDRRHANDCDRTLGRSGFGASAIFLKQGSI